MAVASPAARRGAVEAHQYFSRLCRADIGIHDHITISKRIKA
jgi:hypothetical protein